MANSVSHRVDLPVGFISNGKILDYVEVSPMTGRVRKQLGKPEVRENPIKGIDAVFNNCVQSIAGEEIQNVDILKDLTSSDRDYIVMKIREISMGEVVTFDFDCPNCGEPISVQVNINEDVDVDWLEKDSKEKMADFDNNSFTFTLSSENSERSLSTDFSAKFQLPTGRHQEILFGEQSNPETSNPIESQYDLYYYCLLEWDGKEKSELDFNPFDDCVVDVIDYISGEFDNRVPGPDFTFEVECPSCNKDVPANLGSSDFLLPTNQNGNE